MRVILNILYITRPNENESRRALGRYFTGWTQFVVINSAPFWRRHRIMHFGDDICQRRFEHLFDIINVIPITLIMSAYYYSIIKQAQFGLKLDGAVNEMSEIYISCYFQWRCTVTDTGKHSGCKVDVPLFLASYTTNEIQCFWNKIHLYEIWQYLPEFVPLRGLILIIINDFVIISSLLSSSFINAHF